MAFITKNRKSASVDSGITVISQGTRFVGDLNAEATLHIDGEVHGTITSSGEISIGATGSVIGTIRAKHMLVSGFAEGDIDCECIEIVRNGRVLGDIVCEELIVEQGGRFFGSSLPREGSTHKVERPVLKQDASSESSDAGAKDELPVGAAGSQEAEAKAAPFQPAVLNPSRATTIGY